MTREQLDVATFNSSIANAASERLEVDVSRGDDFVVLVDDGTTGSAPASYDYVVEVVSNSAGVTQQYDSGSGVTQFSYESDTYGDTMAFELTNQSGASANYRVTVLSYRNAD